MANHFISKSLDNKNLQYLLQNINNRSNNISLNIYNRYESNAFSNNQNNKNPQNNFRSGKYKVNLQGNSHNEINLPNIKYNGKINQNKIRNNSHNINIDNDEPKKIYENLMPEVNGNKNKNNYKNNPKFTEENIISENGKKDILKMKSHKSFKKLYLKSPEQDYIKIIEEQKNKINVLEEKIKQLTKKEDELNKRSCEIEEREKMFNNKISFLEDKENMLSKEIKEYENLKEKIDLLDKKYRELQKGIKEKEEVKIQIEKLIKDKNKEVEIIEENKKLTQDNSQLKERIKELEEEIEKLKNKGKVKLKLKLKDSIISLKKPTLIGLNNIGATCFMNSTLQCLSQTINLTKYFLNKNNQDRIINNNIALKNKNDLQLSPVYLELIQKLWDENGPKSFSPNKFMNTIEKMNSLFKTGQAGDAKDFIIFILEQIHKELKTPINNDNNINNIPLNQYDKQNALYYFFNDFKKECSVISDIFLTLI